MPKPKIEFKITVNFLKEGKKFIAYSPDFDLSTCGNTLEQAKKRFEEAVGIFFEETTKKGTLKNALLNLGWQKVQKAWQPPVFIGQEFQQVAFAL